MRRVLRQMARQLVVAAGTVTLAGMTLAAPAMMAPAMAAPAAPAQSHPAKAPKPSAPKPAGVAAPTSDTKPACEAAGAGRAACLSVERTDVRHSKGLRSAAAAAAAVAGYGPADLRSAYSLPSATAGAGETVAVVDAYDDPAAAADLAVYRAQYGLPPCTAASGCFSKANQDGLAGPLPPKAGSAGADSSGWDVEEALDLDMVSAACQNCRIILVEANSNSNTDLYRAEDTAVALGAKFISNSWAGPEYPGQTVDDAHFNHPGVVITASSGDGGYGPLYPAASRYVTSVGGTSLTRDTATTRGWQETAWGGAGSGCSYWEPKPAWQADAGCANRTIADVSAVADPNTGVALYDSYGAGGWAEVGGTSVAAPLIAAAYALAGPPTPGTSPASYPYAHPAGLNDVTSGDNWFLSPCSPSYLCTAGPGYDGVTGLGTPNGVSAFGSGGSSGTITGTVTGKSGPLAGATISAAGYTTTTGPSGAYTVAVPDGSYTVSASAPGYQAVSVAGVTVAAGQATTENFKLAKAAHPVTVSGTVTDGSGHKWPLYAAITIGGYPDPVYTDPETGRYSLSLPAQATYTLTVDPVYPGYAATTAQVTVAAADLTRDIAVPVDPATCDAPGYAYSDTGPTEAFTGWDSTGSQDGWTTSSLVSGGYPWSFNPLLGMPRPPGSDGDFATVPTLLDESRDEDDSLVSPAFDLSAATTPVIKFDSWYGSGVQESASVDLSLDGGATWTTVWQRTVVGDAEIATVPIPQAAGKAGVRVRFHFVNAYQAGANGGVRDQQFPWSIDNVFVGNETCGTTPGGLVTGVVTDHNTGAPLNGATVTSDGDGSQSARSAPTPGDPASGGRYWLFASPGATQFTVDDQDNYAPLTQPVTVAADTVTTQDWSLQAGDVAPVTGSVSVTQAMGSQGSGQLQFLNTGTEPAQVQLAGQASGFTPAAVSAGGPAAAGAPLQKITGHYSPAAILPRHAGVKGATARPAAIQAGQATPAGAAWSSIPDYPTPVSDNATGYDPGSGAMYSAGGYDGNFLLTSAYRFNPVRQQWSAIASLPQATLDAAGGFAGGRFYVAGGVAGSGQLTADAYAYQPSTDSWSQVASLPAAVSAPSTAVLNGALYVVGGCMNTSCLAGSRAVYRYDPSADRWTTLASLPQSIAYEACAGIGGQVVCAGGINPSSAVALTTTYRYDPASNTWSQGAAMPYDNWGMAYSGSGGDLQIAAGVTAQNTEITNQAAQYDPATDTWSALPSANQVEYRGGSSCGLYQVGGLAANGNQGLVSASAEILPGYDQCGPGIPWLSLSSSSFTLQPGQSQTVNITASAATVAQPGTYTAALSVKTNTPYQIQPVTVTMTVTPPAAWSKIAGTVTDAATGQPLAGATIQLCANYDPATGRCGPVTYTMTTDTSGHYQLWLPQAYSPLQVIAAMPGYQPATRVTKLSGGHATVSFALTAAP